MAQITLGDFAKAYVPKAKQTYNIADLPKVSTKIEFIHEPPEGKRTWEQYSVTIGGFKYRVPISVIEQLQTIMKFAPDLEYFKVSRTGTTKDDTRYKVEPVMQ